MKDVSRLSNNASRYSNVQELLAAGDAVISDYSSCGFDYIQLGRPSFLYAEDYEEMIRNILEFSEEKYQEARAPFMERLGYYDDGHASEAVVSYIRDL